MRKLTLGVLGLLAVLAAGLGRDLSAQQQSRAGAIRVVLQPGGIARQRGNQVVRTAAQKDMAVFYQDVLETGVGGRMRARLDDGSILALGAQSRLTVVEHNSETEQTSLQLQFGKVRAQVVEKTRPDAKFEIQTNTAVAGVLGTDEVVDAFSPIATSVLCIEGQIEVRNADATVVGTVILNPGEITIVQQGVVPTPPRPATPEEVEEALAGSGGVAPEAIADIGTGFVTAGDDLALSGVDSFATGTITTYQWLIARADNNAVVYNQTQTIPDLLLDTTTLVPGNYNGTLTITTSNNETATTMFSFVVLPSAISNTSPELVIQQMQAAYETLQPNEFMKLFDPLKYSGYAALQQSVEASFRNLSQARVFVRRASGQMFQEGRVAIYQVDFEIRFSTKAEPNRTFTVRESATLRMESGSGWLITDVPQGQVGGGGLLAIPGSGNPTEANTVSSTGNTGTGTPNIVPEGGDVVVLAGDSNTFVIRNTSSLPVTIDLSPPPGITVTGGGASGTTFTIPAGGSLTIQFTAQVNQPAGTVNVSTSVSSGGSSLPGPVIPVTVARLAMEISGPGASAGSPLPVVLGSAGTATSSVSVSSTVTTGHTVNLSGSGLSFAPNPLVIASGSSSGASTITVTPGPNDSPGADGISIDGAVGGSSVGTTLFVNRIAPFTLTRTSPGSLILATGPNSQPGNVSIDVAFNAPFTGPVQVNAPGGGGVTFSPQTVTLNGPGTASFAVTAGLTPVEATVFEFTATAGTFAAKEEVTVTVALPPLQCSLSASASSVSVAPGQSNSISVTLTRQAGTPRPVDVIFELDGAFGSLFTVSGGGTLPEASGSVDFTVTAADVTPPGSGSFRVRAPSCGTTLELGSPAPELAIGVNVTGGFSFGAPSSISLIRGQSRNVTLDVIPSEGFNAPIDLTYSCSTPDITVSGPPSLAAGQRSLGLEFLASPTSNPAAGPSCSVEGTSGPASAGVSFNILIGSFTLTTTAPSPLQLVVGATPSLPVTVAAEQGFTGNVTLTPAATNGIVVTPGSAIIAGGNGTATFTLSAGPEAQAGNATVTVTATAEGGLSAQLEQAVLVTNGFTLSSSSATFFLGNASPLVVNVNREPNFTGDVRLAVGSLPPSIVSVSPTSVLVTGGTSSVAFEVVAGADPSLAGQSASFSITGTFVPVAAAAAFGPAASVPVARAVTLNASGTLQVPFSLSSGGDLGSVEVGLSVGGSVDVGFTTGFTGSVQVSTAAPAGVVLTGGSAALTASGNVPFTAAPTAPGSYSLDVTAQAGAFSLATSFTLAGTQPPPPPPPPAPVISSFAPPNGPVGTSVTITGFNFPGTTSVTFNGIAASFTVNSPIQITATVPSGATTGPIAVTSAAGTGTSATNFTVTASFSLCVSKGTGGPCLSNGGFVDVNSTIPVALQVSILPGAGFTSPVTVSVADGSQMSFFSGCGTPSGATYSGGTLTFTLSSPYTSPANFCMSAGVPTVPVSDGAVTFTTTVGGVPTGIGVVPTFRIGVPDLTIAPPTFIIPGAGAAPGFQSVDISLSAPSAANVFDLPITVYITGPNSILTGGGPSLDPLPAGISSTDCGPSSSGKLLSPGSTVSCLLSNSNTSPFDSSGTLIVFVTFGPGGGGSVPLGACGSARGVRAHCGAQTMRISSGARPQGADGAVSDGLGLEIAPESVGFTPLVPKAGDTVSIQATVENHTDADAADVKVGLVLNGQTAATLTVSVPAGGSQPVEFLWQAEFYQRLQFELSLDAGEGTAQTVPVRNLFVEPELAGTYNQGRSALEITNGDCGGFRFLLGSQIFCGGSSDLELSPVITADGQLQVQVFSLNGGIVDLGPQPITGQLTVPESGYAAKGWLEPGRLYAVQSQGKYGLLYVSRIQSDIDPRLAKLTGWQTTAVRNLDDMLSDRLNDLLDQARITVVVEWAYLENGSRRFSYGFSGVERSPRPGVIRQPRVPAASQ